MTIALAYLGDLSRVRITLTDLPNGLVHVERSTNQLFWQTVRGGKALVVEAGGAVLDDYEFASDVENFYRLTILELEGPLMEVFEASGTWTKPLGLVAVRVRQVGGGGSGGGCAATGVGEASEGGGGGGGEYAEAIIPASALGATETVTVGTGGAGAAAGAAGSNGLATSFGAHLITNAGSAGNAGAASSGNLFTAGGNGGIGGGGTATEKFDVDGDDGGPGSVINGRAAKAARGGGTVLGAGGYSSTLSSTGLVGQRYGGGSTGAANSASDTARGSTAGAAGVVIVENIFWPPGA
jgi:hypothetical protein